MAAGRQRHWLAVPWHPQPYRAVSLELVLRELGMQRADQPRGCQRAASRATFAWQVITSHLCGRWCRGPQPSLLAPSERSERVGGMEMRDVEPSVRFANAFTTKSEKV